MAEMITTMMETMQENIWKKLEDYIVGSEASHDAEVATIEATNDWDASRPPHGLQTSPDVVDQYLADPQQSQLSWEQISQEFSVAEKTAPAIDEKLAQLVSSLIPEKLSKTKLDELMDKYPRPDNCPLLVAPKCNKVVWLSSSRHQKPLILPCRNVKNYLSLRCVLLFKQPRRLPTS